MDLQNILQIAILIGIIIIALDINKLARAVGKRKFGKPVVYPDKLTAMSGGDVEIAGAVPAGNESGVAANEVINPTPPKGGPHYINVVVLPLTDVE